MDETTKAILKSSLPLLRGEKPFDLETAPWPSTSSRVVEVPWAASVIGRHQPSRLFDIGLSLASLDYLGVLLEFEGLPGRTLDGVDIISPQRVASRYPEEWRDKILSLPVRVGDVRELDVSGEPFDMVTCISVIEHIGFDKASHDNPKSAFERPTTVQEVALERSQEIDHEVMGVIHGLLAEGGVLVLSAPMGRGGPVLLRDSLGYYCAQWEYSPERWESLVNADNFSLVEERFYFVGEDLIWRMAKDPGDLSELDCVSLSHSRGVGMAMLKKI